MQPAHAAVQTSLTYDYLGRVIQVTEQGQTEDYFYSGEKRVFKKEASGKKRLYLFEDHTVVFDREVEFGKRGDADGTGTWTITDAVYLINYIFAGGSSPKPNLLAGDADGNGIITIGDAVWLINFIFAGGPSPSSATLSLSGAANVFAPGAGRLWSDGAMGNEDLYFVEDSVSSTSAVLAGNALGEVIHSTPFGEQLTTSNLEKRYLFTGKELDATTGLFYYGARYYDPALGRFLQWDSVMDGANRYLYVRNNPINANDPSGHEGGGSFWSNIGMPSPGELLGEAVDGIQGGLASLWNTIDEYTSIPGWTNGVRALQATGFNPNPGQPGGTLAFSLLPASGLDLALTALDMADGPAPDLTAAKTTLMQIARRNERLLNNKMLGTCSNVAALNYLFATDAGFDAQIITVSVRDIIGGAHDVVRTKVGGANYYLNWGEVQTAREFKKEMRSMFGTSSLKYERRTFEEIYEYREGQLRVHNLFHGAQDIMTSELYPFARQIQPGKYPEATHQEYMFRFFQESAERNAEKTLKNIFGSD